MLLARQTNCASCLYLLPSSRILPLGSPGNWWSASTMSLLNLVKLLEMASKMSYLKSRLISS